VRAFIIFITLSCILKTSFGQEDGYKTIKYQVNETIARQLGKYRYNNKGMLKASMFIKVTWDGKLMFGSERQEPLDCYTKSFISNDTIFIIGHMKSELGWGFKLTIFKDSCIVNSFALSDGNIYKYAASDTAACSFILVPGKLQQVTFIKQPEFRKGEQVSGYVEITSGQFYYYVNKHNMRSDIKLHAYFKTEPLEGPSFQQ